MQASPTLKRAAQYVRMSTDRQDSSISQQKLAIAAYAAARDYEVVRTYADEGISGLLIDERMGLRSLLADVLAGTSGYDVILVYDVSRWGRFQNPDQAAHYEFLCSDAGVPVEYCAEEFTNDGSFAATVVKTLKRAMAAEYSRELSAKVVQAKDQLGAAGYWIGGSPGYGLRRQQFFADGTPGRVMEAGDTKGAHNGHTRLVPGPPEEVEVIRSIFRMFVDKKIGITKIAQRLNAAGHRRSGGRPWDAHYVQCVLTAPKYAGINLLRRSRRRMKAKSPEYRPRTEWIYVPGAFEALVKPKTFYAAEARFKRKPTSPTDEEMIDGLAKVLRQHGALNAKVIDAARNIPNARRYHRRFGSMHAAYKLAGYEPTAAQVASSARLAEYRRRQAAHHIVEKLGPQGVVMRLRSLLQQHGRLSTNIINADLGPAVYQLSASRFGGGRRLYALAGYRPSRVQDTMFDKSLDGRMTRAEADDLRARVLAGEDVPLTWARSGDLVTDAAEHQRTSAVSTFY